MYKRIVVPVDGSPTSALGLRHAIGLAKDQGARLRVLNVLDDASVAQSVGVYAVTDVSSLLESMRTAGLAALDQATALAQKHGVKTDASMLEGRGRHVSDAILEEMKKWRADLIVMGTHGRRGLNRLLLGSDAERVLREAPVPVLLVRGEQAGKRRTASRK